MSFSKTKAVDYIREVATTTQAINTSIQARDFKKPDAYSIRYSGFKRGSFNPDAILEYSSKKDFYTIEEDLTKANMSEKLYKWILFSMEAKKTKGRLILLVPKTKEFQFTNLLDWKQIEAEVVGI